MSDRLRSAARATTWSKALTVVLCLVSGSHALSAQESEAPDEWTSRGGRFRVSFCSELQPLVINRIHNWVLHVETANGHAVADARITVDGGMPQHNHGLPTEPVMTRYLGDGDYLIEGMRFHMNGYWELDFTIRSGDVQDTVVIPLTL